MPGIVYCLSNPAMPDYVKIGTTADLEQRLKSLDGTNLPVPFIREYAVEVENPEQVERQLHAVFADHRTRRTREFFEVSPERVLAAMELTGGRDVTPGADIVEDSDAQEALSKARSRREAFNFEMVAIAPGTTLQFYDAPDITCVVKSRRTVVFEDKELSLSAAASAVLRTREHLGDWVHGSGGVQGPVYWSHDGESMSDRRRRMEAEG